MCSYIYGIKFKPRTMENKKLNYDKTKFKNDAEYTKFLDDKMKSLMDRITSTPKLLNVFKRLKDK